MMLAAPAIIACLAFFLHAFRRPSLPSTAPKRSSFAVPVLGAIDFFRKRYTFFLQSIAESKSGFFSFYLGTIPVIGVSGQRGKQVYFESSQLDLSSGYVVLFGGGPSPSPEKDDQNAPKGFNAYFTKRLVARMRTENFAKELPLLIRDVRESLYCLAASSTGLTDPFESIYRIVFLTTARFVSCHEVANDPVLLQKVMKYYELIEKSSTPAAVIAPWLPIPAILKRNYAGIRLYLIFKSIADDRKRRGIRVDDCMQMLLDHGDSIANVVSFVVGALYAGVLNSGINASYVLSYLATNPKWAALLREEIASVAKKYGPPNAKLVDKLAHIPLSAWETEFPLNGFCLKESIRLHALGAGFRKNVTSRDVALDGGEVIPPGAYVAWAFYDAHYDPEIWTERDKWDPERYLPGREEDKKKPYAWVGWGTGRHPCLGMRFAKIEQAIIVAHFLTMFDYDLCDSSGFQISALPPADVEAHAATKPSPSIRLRYCTRGSA